MSSKEESNTSEDFIESMASLNVSISTAEASDEIQIINELRVNLEDNHRCDICCEGEFLVDKLLRFGDLINETYKFVCDKCDKNFVYKSELRLHSSHCPGPISEQNKTINGKKSQRRKEVSVLYSVACVVCKKSFKTQSGLRRHMKYKHSNLTHKCEICQEVFTEFKKFNSHCLEHQKSKNLFVFVCSECDERFSSKYRLKKHLEKHKPDDSLTHKCETCQEVFTEYKKFNYHCLKHQKSKNLFVCSVCDEKFSSKYRLIKHLEKHKPGDSLTQKCETCQEAFTEYKNFKYHCLKHQKLKNMFVCSECDERFSSKYTLIKHMEKHKPDDSSTISEELCI